MVKGDQEHLFYNVKIAEITSHLKQQILNVYQSFYPHQGDQPVSPLFLLRIILGFFHESLQLPPSPPAWASLFAGMRVQEWLCA